jgi:PIN domain nuclease of toxin-antitoxin system
MIFLDTHIVVWMYTKQEGKFSSAILNFLNTHELAISPIVVLELQYLYEIKRATEPAHTILSYLKNQRVIKVDSGNWENVTIHALEISWTRDVFDRYIVAHADFHQSPLISKDKHIGNNYPLTISPDVSVVVQKQ